MYREEQLQVANEEVKKRDQRIEELNERVLQLNEAMNKVLKRIDSGEELEMSKGIDESMASTTAAVTTRKNKLLLASKSKFVYKEADINIFTSYIFTRFFVLNMISQTYS